jgi:hypothetical protein
MIKRKINILLSVVVITTMLYGCTNSDKKISNTSSKPNVEEKTPAQNDSAKYDEYQKIYDFVESKFSTNPKNAPIYVEASEFFKKPIIEIMRAHLMIVERNTGSSLKDAEADALNMQDVNRMYVKKGDNWYYNTKEINLGTPLPTPDSMK